MKHTKSKFVVCVKNTDYEASLDLRKIYKVVDDQEVDDNLIRIIDETGEDYLYPQDYFLPIDLSESVEDALSQDASL